MASLAPGDSTQPSGGCAVSHKLSQREQSEHFIETARTLEADESGKCVEKAMRVMAQSINTAPKWLIGALSDQSAYLILHEFCKLPRGVNIIY